MLSLYIPLVALDEGPAVDVDHIALAAEAQNVKPADVLKDETAQERSMS